MVSVEQIQFFRKRQIVSNGKQECFLLDNICYRDFKNQTQKHNI